MYSVLLSSGSLGLDIGVEISGLGLEACGLGLDTGIDYY